MFERKPTSISIPNVPKTAYPTMIKHLAAILPLRNAYGAWNDVQDYCATSVPGIDTDAHRNLYRLPDNGSLAIVAHTDSVNQEPFKGRSAGKKREPFVECGGIISSINKLRPIGGDDKVGIAIALTIGELLPHVSIILPADEEIGCVGSSLIELPYHDLMIQCDRRGSSDLVTAACGSEIASDECASYAHSLLPHRRIVDGMLTDVLTLSERGLCGNAFNLSCGYYEPHTCHEYIVLSQMWQTFLDVWVLFHGIPASDLEIAQPFIDPLDNFRDARWGGWDTTSDLIEAWYKEKEDEKP